MAINMTRGHGRGSNKVNRDGGGDGVVVVDESKRRRKERAGGSEAGTGRKEMMLRRALPVCVCREKIIPVDNLGSEGEHSKWCERVRRAF